MKIKASKLLAVLCVVATIISTIVPMSIFTAVAAEQNATLSFANKAQRTTFTTSQQVWEQNGITITNNKGSSTSNVADYANPARFYKSSNATIECSLGNITKIVFSCTESKYAKAPTITSGKGSVSASGTTVTITITEPTTSVGITFSGSQIRAKTMTVTYEPIATGDCQHANTVAKDEIAPDCTNVGFKAGTFCNDCETYIEGGEKIDALGHTNDDIVPGTDASCTSTGKSETVKCSVCGETTTASTTTPATAHNYVDGACSVCGAIEPVSEIDVTLGYKFLVDYATGAKRLYLTGKTANKDYYFASTENVDDAVTVFVEAVDGGYKIYFVLDDVKTYITIAASGTYVNAGFVTSADDAAVFTWNEDHNTFVTPVSGTDYYIGMYGTYTTFSASKIDFATSSGSFTSALIKVDGADVPTPDPEPGETEPVETEPEETEPAETEPAETEPAETEPSAPAEEIEAELSFADANNRTEYSTTIQVWSANGITLTNNKGTSTSNVGDYTNPARFYASSQIIIAAPGNITKIVFDCNNTSYATVLKNSIGDAAVADGDKVTVTLDGSSDSYTIAKITAQVRMDAITVTYGGAGAPAAKDKIAQVSVNAGADLSMLAHISASDITGYTVKFIRNGVEVLATTYTEKDGKFVFALDKIAPQAMADVITIQLIKDGKVVDTKDYSVKAYAQAILSGDYDAKLKTLVSDMLAYGAAAQKHTGHNLDNLATAGVVGLVCSTATPDASVNVNKGVQNADKVDGLGFANVGVKFDNVNYIFAKFNAASIDGVTVTINGTLAKIVALGNGQYTVYSDAILASQFGATYTIVLNYNGAAYQTLTYSVNSYAFAKNNELGTALYRYGASAAAYLA